uniref:BHLH domain-containing protein n=1 Tax=Schistosoma mansoni TaxID=6183 RepID=A0A3Q0KLZ8_SCHMA
MIPVHSTITNHFSTTNSECEGFVTSDIKTEPYNMTPPTRSSTISRNSMMNSLPSRRGRRSTIPLEIRDEVRRLKKRNTERQRRACISDKMNALHNLAMKLIGEDPSKHSKMEKNDILGICYTIFEGIAKILKDRPELLSRLHNLASASQETKNIKPISHSSDSINIQPNDLNSLSQSFHKIERNSIPMNPLNLSTFPSINLHNQEMKNNSNLNSSIPLSSSKILNESKSNLQYVNTKSKCHTFRLPLKYRWCKIENQNTTDYIHTLVQSHNDVIMKQWNNPIIDNEQKENISHYIEQENVWRPYLN